MQAKALLDRPTGKDNQGKDRPTLRDLLEGLADQGVEDPKRKNTHAKEKEYIRLGDDIPPEGTEFLWDWFWDLSAGRANNGFGFGPISYGEIESWKNLTGNLPSPWMVQAIKAMDAVYCSEMNRQSSGNTG